ncbi:hypothetical protein BS78_09G255300 [Paspalum vaginatum]|nr:hypothetical protein BS78_09G255300 [Paspalum vaginatum]
MASHERALAVAASAAASLMLVRTVVSELLPDEVREAASSGLARLRARMASQHTVVIKKRQDGVAYNHVYEAVRAYLAARIDARTQRRLCVSSAGDGDGDGDGKMTLGMAEGEETVDTYDGAEFTWRLIYRDVPSSSAGGGDRSRGGSGRKVEEHSYEVTFHKKHTEMALGSYLPFIVATAKAMSEQGRALQIYMNEYMDEWCPMDLHHPSTFQTLAMDRKLKQSIVDDLDRFVKRKDYYRRIGKAWRRGYLLYGPPGTGKSSLIAAMANHLRFNVYDLELTAVDSNSDLRRLLVGVPSRSILVVEDIDCTIQQLKQREGRAGQQDSGSSPAADGGSPLDKLEEKGQRDKVTLSGLLNFVDGLWSAGGEERVIVFTTNYKDRLDPALLRPGRMDMHVYMGYCTPEAFRILAHNYHLIDYHATYPEIEELIEAAMVTPAEVAEVLMRNDDTDAALHDLVRLLRSKLDADNSATKTTTEHSNDNADRQQPDVLSV